MAPAVLENQPPQKILIGLLKGFEGEVAIFDRDLRSWGSDYYERIGVSFEVPNHYSKLTGLENLRYFGSLYRESGIEPQELLEMVGLEADGECLSASTPRA